MLKLNPPLIVAPMAGGPSSVDLVAAVSNYGALGSIGAAYMSRAVLIEFYREVRLRTTRPVAINLFVEHPEPSVTAAQVQAAVKATAGYRNEFNLLEPDIAPPSAESFAEQFDTVMRLKPEVLSYVFGLLPDEYMQAARSAGILLIGSATSPEEARALEASGADAVVLQGIEAGGHRAIFDRNAKDPEIGTLDLLKTCKLKIPVIAAGGIMNAADVNKALDAGAWGVQMGTAFLACEEAGTSKPYRQRLLAGAGRKTRTTRVFSGRLARGLENRFMNEMEKHPEAILPFPVQNKFTRDLRSASAKAGSAEFLSLWAGTGQGELWQGPAAHLIELLFRYR